MTIARREFLRRAALAVVAPAFPASVWAQGYPARPVRVIVPYPPAGGTDIVARIICQRLSDQLGQQIVIENRAGANSNIGTEAVVRAQPDGYTLLIVDSAPTINATFYDKLNFNFIRDLAPVAALASQPNVMVVNPSFPAKTVPAFIAYARTNPGRINFASAGNGNINHLAGEIFKTMAAVDIVHVPYRGTGQALTDLIAGQVQVMFGGLAASIEYIRTAKLRALAVTSVTRWEGLPDIPTVSDFVPGYETADWKGVLAPKNTPPEIIDKLNSEFNAALADPKIKMRLADLGFTPLAGSPADFGKLVAGETEKWGKVIRAANIKPG